MQSSDTALRYLLDMAIKNPLLGGVLLVVPGGRIQLPAVRHCTVISPAIDPRHLVPLVDLEASLLAGRRVERPGLLQSKRHKLLVLQRSHDLDVQAAQYITQWLEATTLEERPPLLAVVDDLNDQVPHWLDCRLAFRLQWNAKIDPDLSWLISLPRIARQSTLLYKRARLNESVLHAVTMAAAARGLNDPRYDIMAAAAAHTRAVVANRPLSQEDIEWAIHFVLDTRSTVPENASAESTPYQQFPDANEAAAATAEEAKNATDATGRPATLAPTESPQSTLSEPQDDEHGDLHDMTAHAAASIDNVSSTVSTAGKLVGESIQFAPVAPMPETNRLTVDKPLPLKPLSAKAVGSTTGRYGHASPHKTGRLGRRFINHSTHARIDLAATLRAAVPWQRLRAAGGSRIRVYPQDLKYRQRERRPGTTYFILLDASASMWSRHIAQAKRIALQLIERAYRSRSRIAVIAIRGVEPEMIVPPSRCYNQAYTSILGLEVGGSTPLVPALRLTLSLLTDSKGNDHALVYLLTDGRSTAHSPRMPKHKRPAEPSTASDQSALSADSTAAVDDTVHSIGQALINANAHVTVIGTVPPGQDRAARNLAEALHGLYQSARTANRSNLT